MANQHQAPGRSRAAQSAQVAAPRTQANAAQQQLRGMNYAEGAAALQPPPPQEAGGPMGGSINPLKWGKEVQAFVDFARQVAGAGKRPSAEEFQSVVRSYNSLNSLEKYSASSGLHRAGLSVLEQAIRSNSYELTQLDQE